MDVQLGPSSSSLETGFYHNLELDPAAAAVAGRSQANFMPPPANGIPLAFSPGQAPALSADATDHHQEHHHHHATGTRKMRKRKADSQDNERLSKRLSLLNLEQNGQKLYVPVESPRLQPSSSGTALKQVPEDDQMQLDESKHKVYIYDLDAELSSDGESSSDEGKLVFLPDIEKHLRASRIPPRVLANSDGELAGMQMVLYSEPKSLTVPEAQDSVRKAVVEARARLRRRQNGEDVDSEIATVPSTMEIEDSSDRRVPTGLNNLANDPIHPRTASPVQNDIGLSVPSYDPDAMEMDID